MSSNSNILFDQSGCISRRAMHDFVFDKLTDADRHIVQAHLSTCDMCNAAVNGYVNNNITEVSFHKHISKLNKTVDHRVIQNKQRRLRQRNARIGMYSSVAAILIIFLGVYYILELKSSLVDSLAKNALTQEQIDSLLVTRYDVDVEPHVPSAKQLNAIYKPKSKAPLSADKSQHYEPMMKSQAEKQLKPETKEISELPNEVIIEDEIAFGKNELESEVGLVEMETEEKKVIQPAPTAARARSYSMSTAKKSINVQTEAAYYDEFEEIEGKQGVFRIVEIMPSFKGGGIDKFEEYISRKIKYPSGALTDNYEGEVVAEFIINTEGELIKPEVLYASDDEFRLEVLGILKQSPKWKPGIQNGRPVNVKLRVPVKFEIK